MHVPTYYEFGKRTLLRDELELKTVVKPLLCPGFVLPKGYPSTVSDDYLRYQLRCLPAHITGWMGRSLVTSSLINALNIGASASGTVAASAAIKWITKDGIGAFGRFLVGSYFLDTVCATLALD